MGLRCIHKFDHNGKFISEGEKQGEYRKFIRRKSKRGWN